MYFKSFEHESRFPLIDSIVRNCVSQNLETRHPSPLEHYQINESKTHDRRVIGQTPIKREKKSVNRRGCSPPGRTIAGETNCRTF